MMSFHTTSRWTRRASRLALAALLIAVASNHAIAQDAKAAIAEVAAAATVPVAITPTNTSVSGKPVEPAQSPKDTNATVTAKPAGTTTAVRTNTAPAALDMEYFKLIAARNIFNQSRVKGYISTSSEISRIRQPAVRVEAIALAGTMIYEKGNFAFFDGSNSQYRKTGKVGDAIGAYKLTEVGPNQVRLAGDNQEWTIKVGQELRRENEGEWKLGTRSTTYSGSQTASSSTASPSTDSTTSTSDTDSTASESGPPTDAGPVSETVRRMMEARAKEEGR